MRAFGSKREHGERIGVLAADEAAHRPELGLKCTEGVAESAHVHQPLADGRHDLLVLADEHTVRSDVDLAVEHRPQGVGTLFADADHHIGLGVARGGA